MLCEFGEGECEARYFADLKYTVMDLAAELRRTTMVATITRMEARIPRNAHHEMGSLVVMGRCVDLDGHNQNVAFVFIDSVYPRKPRSRDYTRHSHLLSVRREIVIIVMKYAHRAKEGKLFLGSTSCAFARVYLVGLGVFGHQCQ